MQKIKLQLTIQNACIVALSLGVLALLVITATAERHRQELLLQKNTLARDTVATTTLPSPFSELSLDARAAIVWDVATARPLYSRNADSQVPLA